MLIDSWQVSDVDSQQVLVIRPRVVWSRDYCRISTFLFPDQVLFEATEPEYFCFAVFCVVCFFGLYLVCVFSCTVLFVSISQVIGCEDPDCVWWGLR